MIKREKDMFFGKKDLKEIYSMKHFPIYCGVTEQDAEMDQFADMKWMISSGSGMIQLGELLPLEVLYSVSHNSSYGVIWKKHHEEFATFLHKYAGKKGILEIGGGNGILNAIYNKYYNEDITNGSKWTIIEPSSVKVVEGCTANYIKELFDNDIDLSNVDFDTIVHSHLLEHQYDLNSFMSLVSNELSIGQRMIFTLPDLKEWLKEKYSNALFFEHTYLITEEYVDAILSRYSFSILEKKKFNSGHSLFYATEKVGKELLDDKSDYEYLYEANISSFNDYIKHFERLTNEYNKKMKNYDKVYLFGAHIFSQMLISFGLDIQNIVGILDNDPLKQGKRLYGTKFKVYSPKILKEMDRPVIVLNAGAYTDEIEKDIIENINSNAVIIK